MSANQLNSQNSNYEMNLALAALTAAAVSGNSPDFENFNGDNIYVNVNITALTGTTPSLLVTLQGKDPVSGQYYTLLASVAKTTTGFFQLALSLGGPVLANVSANGFLPRTWRIVWTIAGTTPAVTATIGASVN